jgi:DNA polymerase kappa
MERYIEMSAQIMPIFRQYDPNMLAAGVDEGYLKCAFTHGSLMSAKQPRLYVNSSSSITDFCKEHNLDPDECVQQIRQKVFVETKLTVSAGIAANKVILCLKSFFGNTPSLTFPLQSQ